jgi:hypothetical protein
MAHGKRQDQPERSANLHSNIIRTVPCARNVYHLHLLSVIYWEASLKRFMVLFSALYNYHIIMAKAQERAQAASHFIRPTLAYVRLPGRAGSAKTQASKHSKSRNGRLPSISLASFHQSVSHSALCFSFGFSCCFGG